MTDFNVNTLIKDQYNQQQKKLDIYNKILKKVYNKVELINKRKKTELIYEVPNYIFGYPLYDNRTCIVFIISSLRKKNFYVKFNFPNILFISWKNIVQTSLQKITHNLIKKNEQDIQLTDSQKKINKHFKKENNKLLDDINSLIKTNDSHLEIDFDDDIKKLNDLSDFSRNL